MSKQKENNESFFKKRTAQIVSEKEKLKLSGLCNVAHANFSAQEYQRQIMATTVLHHILPLEYFLQTFAKGFLHFTCIDVWRRRNDIWEGFMFNQHDPKQRLDPFIQSAYAMSWTDAIESRTMWERYGTDHGNGIGVRISVLAQDIACAMCEFWRKNGVDLTSVNSNVIRNDKVSIAPVEYHNECELKKYLDLLKDDQGQQEVVANDRKYFHLKRIGLIDEHEVRVYTQILDNETIQITKGFQEGEFLNIEFARKNIKSISVCPYARAGEIARTITRLSEHGFKTDIVKIGNVE